MSIEKKRLLVVDDEIDILRTVKMSLEMEGYEIITALDGMEALEKARKNNPALIVLDVMLPSIDGYEITHLLKSDEKYKKIPIILLTACVQKKDEDWGKKMGADYYMRKPFDLEVLNNIVKEALIKKN